MTEIREQPSTPLPEPVKARCGRCGRRRRAVDFYASAARRNGLSGHCRRCAKAWAAARYAKRRAYGSCIRCDAESEPGRASCARHLAMDRVRKQQPRG